MSPWARARKWLRTARLGDQDGIDRQAQFGGNRLRRGTIEHLPPEGLPRGRPEVGFDQLEQALEHVLVVLAIPAAAQFASVPSWKFAHKPL